MTFSYLCARNTMATYLSLSVPTEYLELIACDPSNNGSHEYEIGGVFELPLIELTLHIGDMKTKSQ
jgi:hypothetical protein